MIFDFVKNAGEKVMSFFNNDEANETKATKISEFIGSLGLAVNDFNVSVDGEKATLTGKADTIATKEKILVACGNVEGIAQVDDQMSVDEEAQMGQFYTVKSGDSLSKISKEFYGDPMKYTMIFEANKPMLSHPDKIYPGQTLRIPTLA